MADRYWVGGTAAWDGTAGTKWALTSGGTGGQAVPTSADDVYFDAASGAATVTVSAVGFCQNLTTTGFTGTLAGGSNIRVNGSLLLNTGMTYTNTGTIQLTATSGSHTITTAGKTLGAISSSLGAAPAAWSLQDALTCSDSFTLGTTGTFTTNSYSITVGGNFTVNTTNTFNVGTSQINSTGTGSFTFAGGGKTYYNVAFTGAAVSSGATHSITGQNTFNNLSVTGPAVVGYRNVTFAATQTINGELSTTGTAGNRRVLFASATGGIQFDLAINATPSLTDADFRDLRVTGTASPISGTRIGNQTGCSGITFSAPKTVYWNLSAGGNWTANAWAASSGGGVSTDNFPLPQDIAIIENTGLNTSATVTADISLAIGTIDISSRTTAMTLSFGTSLSHTLYGNLKLSTSVSTSGSTSTITFGGRNTQTITSAGRTIQPNITINSFGGIVELVDALNIGSNTLTVTNGTFDTKNFNVTASTLGTSGSNVRTINLGSSTVTLSNTLSAVSFSGTNFTFNAGTSLIVLSAGSTGTQLTGGGFTFYDVSFTGSSTGITATISGNNTYRNLSFTAPSSAACLQYIFSGNSTVTGTLTCAGATPTRRIFLLSDTLGTTRTFTVNSLSATDCDFRDITIAGAAAGSSPTRAGDCGGNSGITFPAAKTVYWNLGGGSQDWSATAWAPGSGGTPDINNFPLAQDTAVFDNAGAITRVATDRNWNIGTVNMSGRTTAMEWSSNFSASYYGNWLFGTGVTTISNSGQMAFRGRGTQTITSNGVTFNNPVGIDGITGTVQLADALILASSRTLTFTSGTFNAVTYNVTAGAFSSSNSNTRTLRMGTGIWTLGSTGTLWGLSTTTNLVFYKDSANIVLSDTGTSSRTFQGGGLSYNKLTIGGTTGTSTLTFSDGNQFTELASTKTVAHTIALGSTTQTFGKWSVTGTVGNVVTITGTGTSHVIAGERVTGVNYLAMGTIGFSTTSPGEFYAGPNSTGTGAGIILTAAPTPVTRYWRGGTGTWDATNTTNWSDTSGGSGGFSVPTSADTVIFDSASNATAYTVTISTAAARCGILTIGGPASGNLTLNSSTSIPLIAHDNVTFAATGVVSSNMSGGIVLSGSTPGKTFTTNGVALTANTAVITINGVGSSWSLGSATNLGSNAGLTVTNGSFSTANYALTTANIASNNTNSRSLSLGSSTITMSGSSTGINFGTALNNTFAFTFDAGTSQINLNVSSFNFNGNGQTFYNVSLTGTPTITGANTFNNLTISGNTTTGVRTISIPANQTINGTLTFSAGTNVTRRTAVTSNTIGTTRTLTCAAFSATDCDFRDITIDGAAAPASGTRLGDLGGNSGITMSTPKTVYWNLSAGGNWSDTAWAPSSGGTPDVNNFPLAQDTVIIENTGLTTGNTITMNASWHIGTINMSTRTNGMTLAIGLETPLIYGDWASGTAGTITGTGTITFTGRGTQTITSNGRTFAPNITINNVSGTVQLADSLTTLQTITLTSGTFNAVSYNVTCSAFVSTGTATRTLSMGSGLWTLTGVTTPWNVASTGLTFNKGTANIIFTANGTTAFTGGGLAYNKFTIGGIPASTVTISGNNTFTEIASTRTVAYTISLGSTTQTVGAFTVSGSAGNLVTISGTSAASPATLIFTGPTFANVNFIIPTFLRVYDLFSDWYAGDNSTNGGSYGWIFAAGAVAYSAGGQFFMFF